MIAHGPADVPVLSVAAHAGFPLERHAPLPKTGVVWRPAEGSGKMVSWVVFRVAYHEAFKDKVPYNVALVELKEGPRLISSVLASLARTLRRRAAATEDRDGRRNRIAAILY